jgi:hypothetical protein
LTHSPHFRIVVQVLNAGKNELTKMDEVTSLTSLGALILNGNTTDEYSRLSITLISLVGNMLDFIEPLQFLMQITIFLPSASLISCNS